jgi:hypothetical protein
MLVLVAGTLAAAPIPRSFVEEFDNTTYKDVANTTADWNIAAGKLKLFPFVPTLLGSFNSPGTATGIAISGTVVYLADGIWGLRIIGVGNPASPVALGSYVTPGWANGVAVSGSVAYVADSDFGLRIVNVSNPASPTLLGSMPGNAYGVAVSGTVAYVAGATGLEIINVSNPASPILLGTYDTPGIATGVAISGTVAYVADGLSGLQIINVSNPASPTLLGSYNTTGNAYNVAVSGNRAYVADGGAGLRIINVSNPASPTLLGSYNTPGDAYGVTVSGTVAYVSDQLSGMQIIDTSNPASPALIGTYDTPGLTLGVAVSGNRAYLADRAPGLLILQVATHTVPTLVGSHGTPDYVLRVAISGSVAYMTDPSAGLRIIDVSSPASPALLGSYTTTGARDVAVSGTVAYVARGNFGFQIINVGNPASPTLLGSYFNPTQSAHDIAISGRIAYVAGTSSGLLIFDVSNPASPTLLGSYHTPSFAEGIAVSGTVAYVADGLSLQIINVSNPASPVLLGSYTISGARDVAISGTVAYVAADLSGLQIIDVSNPATPVLLGSYDTPDYANEVAISGSVAYVANGALGLRLLDVSNPASPTLLGSYDTYSALGVALSGMLAYVADESQGLKIIEVMQNRFVLTNDTGVSLAVDGTSEPLRRVRLTSTQVDNVSWGLRANVGSSFQSVTPGPTWNLLGSGSDLMWRAQLAPIAPIAVSPPAPEASRVTLEWLYRFPIIDAITDVPNDQGGRVRLRFTRADSDFADEPGPAATGYQIYHRVDDVLLSSRVRTEGIAEGAAPLAGSPLAGFEPDRVRRLGERWFLLGNGTTAVPPGTWEAVAWVAAMQTDSYLASVATSVDSTSSGTEWSVYFVTVHTTTPSIWHASFPDSGHSIDNLAPNVPTGLAVAPQGGGRLLTWDDPVDEDFSYFRVYRSNDPDFTPGPATLVHSTITTSWNDATPSGSTLYYKLTATDFAGNESAPASIGTTVDVVTSTPARFALHAPMPNPFRGTTALRFDVPASGGRVRLVIHDIAGRRVRTLLDGAPEAGTRSVTWEGRDDRGHTLAAGLYLCRMEAPGFSQVRRLMLTR